MTIIKNKKMIGNANYVLKFQKINELIKDLISKHLLKRINVTPVKQKNNNKN
jgi:hypothetical protein